ncbi:hypothetical protein MUBE_11425 [Mycobacterium uberis]|uniref:Uncharacterized protein n=1 Tax=Mycobacterium uberis TaxID=2162698 RepID=A0A3E1HFD0_9MYCO|nr:hypothetical protein [Mycobacterium uberis]RFD25019.1 hypothetical protein MUBE_11425 [Mycobacterium uberis]
MFTLLVSWLLVAGVPGLLIIATLGLGQLEKELAQDTVSVIDVAEFLEHAEAVDVDTLAREGMAKAMVYLCKRQAERLHDSPLFLLGELDDPADTNLPAPLHRHARVSLQFDATQHVNRV